MLKKYYKYISALGTLAILYILVTQINFADVTLVINKVRFEYLLAAFVAYLFLNLARTYRFYKLLHCQVNFWRLFIISFSHAFINSVMPARTGELAYIFYIKKEPVVTFGNNVASLFISRAFDTLVVVLFTLLAMPFILGAVVDQAQVALAVFGGGALIVAVFAFFIFWETKVIWITDFIFGILQLKKFSVGNKVLEKIKKALGAIKDVRELRLFIDTLLSSVGVWLSVYLMAWFVALGFGIQISFWGAVFMTGLPALANILPFYTVGNFGIFEGSKSLALVLMGFSKELAISFSFVSHVAEISLFLLPGIISYLILARNGK
jgi:uncharacterized protein (TIRG00374 family)